MARITGRSRVRSFTWLDRAVDGSRGRCRSRSSGTTAASVGDRRVSHGGRERDGTATTSSGSPNRGQILPRRPSGRCRPRVARYTGRAARRDRHRPRLGDRTSRNCATGPDHERDADRRADAAEAAATTASRIVHAAPGTAMPSTGASLIAAPTANQPPHVRGRHEQDGDDQVSLRNTNSTAIGTRPQRRSRAGTTRRRSAMTAERDHPPQHGRQAQRTATNRYERVRWVRGCRRCVGSRTDRSADARCSRRRVEPAAGPTEPVVVEVRARSAAWTVDDPAEQDASRWRRAPG